MPSPFPGMDPYLEHPAVFPGFHDRFITYLSEQLQPVLPSPYFAEINDRLWVEASSRSIDPDAMVFHAGTRRNPSPLGGEIASSATGTIQSVVDQPIPVEVLHDELRETFLNIYSTLKGEQLVTSIEVLSPSNKKPGPHARSLYLQKQRETLGSQVHLVEIDLLRLGLHTTAVAQDRFEEAFGQVDYHVCTHRFDEPTKYFINTISLQQKLPTIPIPLLPGDGDVALDLQAAMDRCYETGPYKRRIDYSVPPQPPLPESLADWAVDCVTASTQSQPDPST